MKKVLKKIYKVFDSIFLFALIIVLCITSIYFIKAFSSDSGFSDVFGYTPLIVVSGSMEPAIKVNDIVIVKKAHYSELQTGDIVVYNDKIRDVMVIHRLISIQNGNIITKGDANFAADIPFSVVQIYGKKVLTIPYLGQFIYYLKTHVIAMCLFLIFMIIYFSFIVLFCKQKKLLKNKCDEKTL